MGKVKEVLEEVEMMFWESDEGDNLKAGDFVIINQRDTGKCLPVFLLNNKTMTFSKYEEVETAIKQIPLKDLQEYLDDNSC